MPRYIDADALYKETEKKIKEANSYRMAVVDSEFLDLINDADEVDVVPRDEVAKIFEEIERNIFKFETPYQTLHCIPSGFIEELKEKYIPN